MKPALRVERSEKAAPTDEWLEAFERDFWPEYPRKIVKFQARKVWQRVRPQDEAMRDRICDGLDRWKAYWESHGTEPQFIPHASTWLNQQRWEDEV